MARLLFKNVLLISLVTMCILAGKGNARPSEDGPALDDGKPDEYVNDDNYNYDDDSPERTNESSDDEAYTGPPPVITDIPLNITVQPGSTVWLPCNTVNSATFVVIWMNGSNFISTDSILHNKDPRLLKHRNNTMQITNVGPDDSAMYTCEISAQPVVKVVHTLHVPSPARIIEMNPKKTVWMKGDSITLECIVSGYPKPAITWMRKDKNKRLPSGEEHMEATSITMENVNRHHEGTYECTASNGLGQPVRQSVSIRIHYAPEISIDKETVNTAEGYESELTCTVHAEPKASVEWFLNGNAVQSSAQVSISKEGGKNILRLANTKKHDFGAYTCKAQNSIGMNEKVVKLSGLPTQPTLMKTEESAGNGLSEMLVWTIESSSPITEYELKYRKEKMDWKMSTPVVENPEGNKYTVKHELLDLNPGKYEAYIRAKNTYGWSEPSKMHYFSADQLNGDAAAKTAATSTNGVEDLRPRIFTLLSVLGVCAFLL